MRKEKLREFLSHIDKKAIYKLLWWAIILVVLSLWVTTYIGEEQIISWVERAGIWWPIVIVLWKALSVVVAPLSGTVTYVIAWWLFGVLRGSIYNLIGNALGMTIWFYVGRIWWIDVIKRIIGKKSSLIVKEITYELADLKTLIITRIVLFPLEDLINFACGMSKIRYPVFLIVSLIITSIVATIWVWVGDVLF